MGEFVEFYAPFAHVPGRYEWCRIHSVSHGSFACFIVIHGATDRPVTLYHCTVEGERFMADRYPESEAIRVHPSALRLEALEPIAGTSDRVVRGRLVASAGPIATAQMTFRAPGDAVPRAMPYGGADLAVWGSRWSCEGVDMEVDASVIGYVLARDGCRDEFSGDPAIMTLGSYGRLRER